MNRCPNCRSDIGTRVLSTRHFEGAIYRRRGCKNCQHQTATVETPTDRMPRMAEPGPRIRARSQA